MVGVDPRLVTSYVGDQTGTNLTSYILGAASNYFVSLFYRRNIIGISTQSGPFRMAVSASLNSCALRVDNAYVTGASLNLAGMKTTYFALTMAVYFS